MKSFSLFKNSQELWKIILINFFLLFVFVELGSLGWYYVRYKQFFYTRAKLTENDNENENNFGINLTGVRLRDSIVERLHPYFGFVQKPGPDFRKGFKYNAAGFISPYDYPYQKTNDNQYIVGVFGGSVASNYSIYEIQNKILGEKLKQLPGLKDKEIIILSFAAGGYKQPQQLLVLNYFLSVGQEFDMIINIDGFNEVAFANENNESKINISMPSSQHVVPLTNIANNSLSEKALRAMLRINESKSNLKGALETLENCQLAYCYALTSLYVQNLVSGYRQNVKTFDKERRKASKKDENQGSIVYFYSQNPELDEPELFGQAANNWVKTSTLMQQIASSNNIAYFHFLQPNQYFPTNRVFSEEEKKVAFSDDTPYQEAVELGYPLLLNKISNLQNNGVNIFNAVNILDNSQEFVYIDSCCHYTEAGEQIFSDFIANSIVGVLTKNTNKIQTQNEKNNVIED
ncbi:MAG: hypothetical protein QNJ68_17800 [Microcoleaceae cyanobacterium MO_207.B10]|nr:hypothetical protein [Microcoleaceae cyanobacterium MO_207.B10]